MKEDERGGKRNWGDVSSYFFSPGVKYLLNSSRIQKNSTNFVSVIGREQLVEVFRFHPQYKDYLTSHLFFVLSSNKLKYLKLNKSGYDESNNTIHQDAPQRAQV